MPKLISALAVILALSGSVALAAPPRKPVTIVLVHGAFAESASWNRVAAQLKADGYHVIAAANPLRGVKDDAASVGRIVAAVQGPVVLVGHSYGGAVISEAGATPPNVKALVFVAAFAPDAGENALELTGRFPGGTLGQALAPPVMLPDGSKDLYIDQNRFGAQFAADVAPEEAALMAATQRPVRDAALTEASGPPAWRRLPSWFVYGTGDRNIPPAALGFMAKRADSKKTVVIDGASHVVMVSHPKAVAEMIEAAATAQP
ncbi:alpha/beta hydrolase [Caulobacter sp. Root656]|nr:alpha/beta hydrolase [Caulobacter sp. Root656]